MKLHNKLRMADVIGPVSHLIGDRYVVTPEGKIEPIIMKGSVRVGPWINVRPCPERHCELWTNIYFKYYRIISRNCFNCFKVVARPSGFEEAKAMLELQRKMGYPSKTGIERRANSKHKGLYVSFWYCPLGDLDRAKELHKEIELRVKREFGIQKHVILKRGCTEMEDAAGPSHEWKFPEEQHFMEDLLDATWNLPKLLIVEPSVVITHTLRLWIEHSIRGRDKEVEPYTDGPSSLGVVPTTTYHDIDRLPQLPEFKKGDEDAETPILQGLPSDE